MENPIEFETEDISKKLKENKPYKVALKYGVILALVIIIIDMVFFILTDDPSGANRGGFAVLQSIILGVLTIILASKEHSRNELSGYLPYGRIVGIGALLGLFSGIITSLYMLIKVTYMYDADLDIELKVMEELDKKAGTMSEEEYEMSKEMALKFAKIFVSPVMIFVMSLISSVFWNTILSLLVGIGIKNEIPK